MPFHVLRVIGKFGNIITPTTVEVEINAVRKTTKTFGTSLLDFVDNFEKGIKLLINFGFKYEILPHGAKRPTFISMFHQDPEMLGALRLLSNLRVTIFRIKTGSVPAFLTVTIRFILNG
jgi:hypothetical protein